MMGRLIGIDHGLARIGLAVSDALGISARALAVLHRTTPEADMAALRQHITQQNAVGLVLGVPSNRDARGPNAHRQADIVAAYADALRATFTLPLVLWDEQLSSADAHELARQLRRDVRAPVDDLAARVILQSYLDALADGLASPPS